MPISRATGLMAYCMLNNFFWFASVQYIPTSHDDEIRIYPFCTKKEFVEQISDTRLKLFTLLWCKTFVLNGFVVVRV